MKWRYTIVILTAIGLMSIPVCIQKANAELNIGYLCTGVDYGHQECTCVGALSGSCESLYGHSSSYHYCSYTGECGDYCTDSWAVAGTTWLCQLNPNLRQMGVCALMVPGCVVVCSVPPWVACVACLGTEILECTGCMIVDCAETPGTRAPFYMWTC